MRDHATARSCSRRPTLNKTFGGLKAVNDVSFALRAGIVTTLVGPNGAGKTTLFNAMTGHLAPDTGDGDLLLGKPIAQGCRTGRSRDSASGRTFQDLQACSRT